MKITTTDEMRDIDRATSTEFGVPSLVLMENAGTSVAQFAMQTYPNARSFAIVCGKGNNGGDGFVAARKLKEAGREVLILLLAKGDEVRGDAAVMFERMSLPFVSITCSEELNKELSPALTRVDVLIDAILGTGFRPPVRGLYAQAIEMMNNAAAPVVSVDIPSGADSDALSPTPHALTARSDAVVTFTAPRPAHVFAQLTGGPIIVAQIGSPEAAVISKLKLNLITARDIARLFSPRRVDGHKGSYGHALIVGGSVGKAGAAAMAGISALRSGAGLSTVATAESALPMVAAHSFEIMTEPLAQTEAGTISLSALEYGKLDSIASGKDVIAFGPGISRNPDTVQFVRAAIGRYQVPTVIDADGLNAFEGKTELLNGSERPLIVTPHPGEMARLTGLTSGEIQANRIEVARRFAREHRCIVVLKGYRTIVALPDETVWVNPTGNPGMATGGTGDVLTGIVAGMIAQNRNDIELAVLGSVYLHGLAGDVARERMGEQAMIAGDLITQLPEAISRVRAGAADATVRIQ